MFENFCGNTPVARALERMIAAKRVPQTVLFAGPEGVGKATLARRFAAALLGDAAKIERDDLNLASNLEIVANRERWPADKRNEDPLLFSTHPDFVTFAPDGPLRQISIQQMRLLKERALFKPLRGDRRVFLIDHIDRAGEQAANSLLKTLEEPPEHLIVILTAENPYDLLPTIRSRAVPFFFARLSETEMRGFAAARGLQDAERRIALAAGSPGLAVSLDLEAYGRRRDAMLTLIEVASGAASLDAWIPYSESIGRGKSEKLDQYLQVLYGLLHDLLVLREGAGGIRNQGSRRKLEPLAARITFAWMKEAVKHVDEINELLRRNIQKAIALDNLILTLRAVAG